MVSFHTGMPRHHSDRYIAVTTQPHPSKVGWWIASMATHDRGAGIVIETMDEAMTPEGTKSRAAELARSKDIRDVIILGDDRLG